MAIQSVGDQNSWAQFMKAAESARQRNRGFGATTNPRRVSRPAASGTDALSGRAYAPQNAALAQKLYAPRTQPQPQKAVAGTRFDAYA